MAIKYMIIRFFRSYFVPMNPASAEKWYRRAKIAYLFTAFQVAGFTLYLAQKDKFKRQEYEVDEPQFAKMIRILELENVKVVNVGFDGIKNEFETTADEVKEKYNEKKTIVYSKYVV